MPRHLAACTLGALLCAAPLAAQQAEPDSAFRNASRIIYHEFPEPEREWGYAQAIVVGKTIYVSGTVAPGATMEAQVAGIYARLARTLEVHGFTLQDVVRETVFTRDMQALAAANAARKRAYGSHTPAATWVEVARLLSGGALVEIEVTAVKRGG